MKGFLFIDLNMPIQSSIIIYIIFIVVYILFFQKYYNMEKRKYMLPVIVITLSIVIFYVFKLLQIYFT